MVYIVGFEYDIITEIWCLYGCCRCVEWKMGNEERGSDA
mgnify:CR=1 FL=1